MHNHTSRKPARTDPSRDAAWYRQPVLWLGIVIFTASIAGCVWMIVLGVRHEDPPVAVDGRSILHMPVERNSTPDPAPERPVE